MKYPKTISPCPIIDAIFEIRFSNLLNNSAVFGVIYSKFREEYDQVFELPVMQIPEKFRESDVSLKYKPTHLISSKSGYKMQIGPNMITISSPAAYVGWNKFYNEIEKVIKIINELEIIKNIERIGLRYIDFFQSNIFDNINLVIESKNKSFNSISQYYRTDIMNDNIIQVLQISNSVEYSSNKGSIIDTDSFIENIEITYENVLKKLEDLHQISKSLFFDLLSDEFIENLNPVY